MKNNARRISKTVSTNITLQLFIYHPIYLIVWFLF